ncbi:MAG: ParB N-terminal domain-containing protein [Thermoleophilia bacterium]|nr:ParB N-terminal domain-containing protein [Thermoleophilia bacterium]
MSDVDQVQIAEEAAAQRAEAAEAEKAQKRGDALRREPLRATATKARGTREVGLDQIHAGDNIRLDLPEIQELARSIREVGLLTPLIVRPWDTAADADGSIPQSADQSVEQYRLIAGHRRLAALNALLDAGVLHFNAATCEVREGLSEAEYYALMLTENVQRVPLEPVQAARALRLLLDLNEELDASQLAKSLGLKAAWAQTHLKLLDLPAEVLERVEAGDLSVTIADLLRKGQTAGRIDETRMIDLAAKVASGEITKAQVRTEAGPPKNTQAPRTVAMGADGTPVERDADGSWGEPVMRSGSELDRTPRPATPLSGPSPRAMSKEFADELDQAPAIAELPIEEQLDVYLLGRVLREWGTDDYLDTLGIDRTQCEAYASALDFEERIGAIRHASWVLMENQRAGVTA